MESEPAVLTPQQRAEEALQLLNDGDPNKAVETIAPLKESEPNFWRYFTAKVDFRRNDCASALTHLLKITDADSALLPNVYTLAQDIIPKLVRQQIRRASELFDEKKYNDSKKIINSLLVLGKESQFCHFMLGKIAQKEKNLRLAVEHLAQVTNIRENNSVITRDFYTPAQKILAEILNEQAEIARAALEVRDFNSAKTAILIIEACNTESAFCNYIKAEIANREGKTSSALDYLGSATENAESNKNKSLITFDTNTAIQNMLVGLVTGQLKEKSKYKAQFIPVENLSSAFSHVSFDSEEDFRTENIDTFVKVTRLEGFGIRFHFTKALSFESQLRVLENLKTRYAEYKQDLPAHSHLDITLFGEDIKNEAEFLSYLSREQALIKGHIAAEKGLWAKAHAYYYQAFSFGIYKEELAHLMAFHFDRTDMIIDGEFTNEQRFAIIQSLFINNLINTETYVRWLGDLRCVVLFPPLPAEHVSQERDDDDQSLATGESSALGDQRQPPKDKEPAEDGHSSEEEVDAQHSESSPSEAPQPGDTPPLSEDDKKLVGKIQTQILLFDTALKTENAIEQERWAEETKFTQTKKLVYGEDLKDYSKRFFESAWNLSRFKPLNAIAVFFAAFAFLPALARKKYQLTHREDRSPEQKAKDDKALNERRTEMRDNYFEKVRRKESLAESKHHLMLAPKKPVEEMRAVEDEQLAASQVNRAKTMRLSIPGSPTKTK